MKLRIVSIEGGLGNQMFQYAFYLNLKFSKFPNEFIRKYIAPYEQHNGYELDTVFNIKKNKTENLIIGFVKKYLRAYLEKKQEHSMGIYESVENNNNLITYYCGYWQSEKYFIQVDDIIRSVFKFDEKKISLANKHLIQEMSSRNSVSIHIRRGDYITDQGAYYVLGGNCNVDYYEKSIEFLNQKINEPFYYIFSDDAEWSKEQFGVLKNSVIIDWNKNENSWQDMMLMSKCKHNIIANSSFSWWGAWLNSNSNKIVIAPQKWFNISDAEDIVPKNWIRF